MELVIFVVTLSFALLMRGLPGKPLAPAKSGKQQVASAGPSSGRSQGRTGSSTLPSSQKLQPSIASNRCRTAAAGSEQHSGGDSFQAIGASQSSHGAGGRGLAGREAWQLADEIVDGMKEQQSLKFASKALMIYDELKAGIKMDNLRLSDVFCQSRHPSVE